MGTALTTKRSTPQYAVERASDNYTLAKSTASSNANLLGENAGWGDAEMDLVAIINAELPDALQFCETEMGQKRAKATEYYNGELFGNEEDGRSKVVSRDVLAAVKGLMPSIMRTFFGGRRRVKYGPSKASDIAGAEQATEFVNKIVMQVDNQGFLEFYSAVKDALIRYQGVFKWWWDDAKVVETDTYTGLDETALLLLANDPQIVDIRAYEEDQLPGAPQTFSAIAKRVVKHAGKARFGCVPQEEVLTNRDAQSIETARFLDHRRVMVLGELVALGYDKDDLLEYAGATSAMWSVDKQARVPTGTSAFLINPSLAELSKPITYHEVYVKADMDGDGFPELIKACGAGDGSKFNLLHWEPVSEIPFCSLDPDPEPHAMYGLCPGGNVMDIQLIKSALLRMSLDGAALALDPRLEVVEHMVELDDLLNPDLGGIVRTRAPGQIAPVRYDFNPAATQGLLEYMDQEREERNRQSRPSQGLDADAMQSSSKLAVAATLSGAQGEQEMICRLFAEGVKKLFRGILGLYTRHASQPRMMQFRGEWVEVDPRTWNAEMNVEVEVGIGVGGVEMEIQALEVRKATQEGILQLFGAENPVVTYQQYRQTLVQLDELRGLADSNEAYRPIPADWKPAPAGPKSDAEILAESAKAELELKREIETKKLELQREEMMMKDQRERVKIAYDFHAALAQTEATTKVNIDQLQVEKEANATTAQLEHERGVLEATIAGMTETHAINKDAEVQQAIAPTQAPV